MNVSIPRAEGAFQLPVIQFQRNPTLCGEDQGDAADVAEAKMEKAAATTGKLLKHEKLSKARDIKDEDDGKASSSPRISSLPKLVVTGAEKKRLNGTSLNVSMGRSRPRREIYLGLGEISIQFQDKLRFSDSRILGFLKCDSLRGSEISPFSSQQARCFPIIYASTQGSSAPCGLYIFDTL